MRFIMMVKASKESEAGALPDEKMLAAMMLDLYPKGPVGAADYASHLMELARSTAVVISLTTDSPAWPVFCISGRARR